MNTELVIKDWKIEDRKGTTVISGNYAVMVGEKEVATQAFNGEYGGTPINFPREIEDKAKELSKEISKSIKEAFTN